MDVYLYQASLLCADCARDVECKINDGFAENDPRRGDSEHFPQGPYADGGGEADSPQHCDHCGTFLDNPLTDDGLAYVRDKLEDGRGCPDVLAVWRNAYGLELDLDD